MKRFDLRGLVCFGSLVFAASCWLNTWMSPDYAGDQFVFSNVIRALGNRVRSEFHPGLCPVWLGLSFASVSYDRAEL